MFVGFLEPQIQLAIDRLLPTPTHQCKALGTNKSVKGFCKFLDILYQKALPKVWFLSHFNNLLTIGDRQWRKLPASFKSQLSKFTSLCPVECAYFCMGAYKYYIVAVITIFMGAYFVWVPSILILWYLPFLSHVPLFLASYHVSILIHKNKQVEEEYVCNSSRGAYSRQNFLNRTKDGTRDHMLKRQWLCLCNCALVLTYYCQCVS